MADYSWHFKDALLFGDIEKACSIVKDPATPGEFIQPAAFEAVSHNSVMLLEACINRGGFDISEIREDYNEDDDEDEGACSLVEFSCMKDHLECLQCLYKHGADVTTENPFIYCFSVGAIRCIRWFITESNVIDPVSISLLPLLKELKEKDIHRNEVLNLVLDHGLRFNKLQIEYGIVWCIYHKLFDDDMLIKLIDVHNFTPSGKILGYAFIYNRVRLAHYIISLGIRDVQIPIAEMDEVKTDLCIFLVYKFGITHFVIDDSGKSLDFYIKCCEIAQKEHKLITERGIAFAGCTHKRLGSDSPLQQFLDRNLMDYIIKLALPSETLTVSFYS